MSDVIRHMRTTPQVPAPCEKSSDDEIRRLRDRFEVACRSGEKQLRIEDYLTSVVGEQRSTLLKELLSLELASRRQRGEQPTLAEYRMRFADFATVVEEVFAIAASAKISETTKYLPNPSPSTTPSSSDGHPAQIGKYRVVQLLGRGGQAVVYRAVHVDIPGRDVVIKWANAGLPAEAQRSILEEGRILAELEDPGLVRVYDVDVAEGRPFVVFEYVAGRTLRDEAKGTTIEAHRAAKITADLARTIEQVHRRGVLHRDLKPTNVLIDAQGRTRVLDFGLGTMASIWTEARDIDTRLAGTLPYMAPEQATGQPGTLGPWTDVYGLGAILYELLTGRPPHDLRGLTLQQALDRIRSGNIGRPTKLQPRVPKDLESIVMRALDAEPSKRYANAGELEAALRKMSSRGSLPLRQAIAVLVAVFAIGAAYLFIPRDPIDPPSSTTAAKPSGPPITIDRTVPPLEAQLNVRVWSGAGKANGGISITDPGALPVRNGEQIHIDASLNRNAYLYLIWIGTDGKVTRLDEGGSDAPPRSELHSPAKLDEGWEVIGTPGVETIVLLASGRLLDRDLDFASLIGPLPPTAADFDNGVLTFIEGRNRVAGDGSFNVAGAGAVGIERGPGAVKKIDDPVLRSLDRLRERFDLVKAVRFAHR